MRELLLLGESASQKKWPEANINWGYEVQYEKESQSTWWVKASLTERLRLKVQKRVRRTEMMLSCTQLARTTKYRAAALVLPVGRFGGLTASQSDQMWYEENNNSGTGRDVNKA